MLKQFNKFLYNYIVESSESEEDAKRSLEFFTTNDFFFRYIEPARLASSSVGDVIITRQRVNTFLVSGTLKAVKAFFSAFKVDDAFMENPAEFKIYSPTFTYGDVIHNLKYDEDYPVYKDETRPESTHYYDNETRAVIHGTWYSFIDETGRKIKSVKPAEITKYFKEFYPKANSKFSEDIFIYVEFQIDCSNRANTIYDKMSEYAKTPDEMNEAHNEDPADFDYTKMNVKNENDEDTVKAALKDVKRTNKDFTK